MAVAATLAVTLAPEAASARPRDPGDGAITAAQQAENRKAAEVGRLSGLVARADGDMRRARDRAGLAVERHNKAVVDLGTATARAVAARAGVVRAGRAVARARADFGTFARHSYMQGSTVGSATSALLDAGSPTDLLQRADLLTYASRRRLDAIGRLDRATVRRANTESRARQLLAAQRAATERADRLRVEAAREVAAARSALASLRTRKAALNAELTAARVRLTGLVAERARYRAWKRAQEAAAAREAARQRTLRAEARARAEAAAVAAAAAARAAERAGRAASRAGTRAADGAAEGSAGRAGSRTGSRSGAPRRDGGGWSPATGRRVADLALRWLGTPYSWGGGTRSGPTWGTDGPVGFDCSGLTLWAWGQVGVHLPHYSGYQYNSGRRIPSSDLMPGDLVFWAHNPSDPGTIHHVALYLGGGRVVQAPQTGDVVKISPMWYDGYIGAARPGA